MITFLLGLARNLISSLAIRFTSRWHFDSPYDGLAKIQQESHNYTAKKKNYTTHSKKTYIYIYILLKNMV